MALDTIFTFNYQVLHNVENLWKQIVSVIWKIVKLCGGRKQKISQIYK